MSYTQSMFGSVFDDMKRVKLSDHLDEILFDSGSQSEVLSETLKISKTIEFIN